MSRRSQNRWKACVVASIAVAALWGAACGERPPLGVTSPLEPALLEASERGVPVLTVFYAEWCMVCRSFENALENEPTVRRAVDRVAFARVDGETERGSELAAAYGAATYPTFAVLDAEGRLVDRFAGWLGPRWFTGTLDAATEDLTPVDEKRARFARAPSTRDALVLARIAGSGGQRLEAARLYEKAAALDPEGAAARLAYALSYRAEAFRERGEGDLDAMRSLAGRVFADDSAPAGALLRTARLMVDLAPFYDDPSFANVYVVEAVARSGEIEDEELAWYRDDLRILAALRVDRDIERAIELKHASMPRGWRDDPQRLNEFAWWCFEHDVNLEEAERAAKRAVELAEPGVYRAMIFDTVAEIRNARGDAGDAVAWIERAIEDDPENAFYRKQLARFREEVARRP